jgi:hypothetical protein
MSRRTRQMDAHDEPPEVSKNPAAAAATAIHVQSLSYTKPVLSSILHAPLESYKGGQGVGTILTSRDRPPRCFERMWKASMFTMHGRYWRASIFTMRGRAAPILPQLVYAVYCAFVVVVTIKVLKSSHEVDGQPDKTYREWMERMKALQYPIASIGTFPVDRGTHILNPAPQNSLPILHTALQDPQLCTLAATGPLPPCNCPRTATCFRACQSSLSTTRLHSAFTRSLPTGTTTTTQPARRRHHDCMPQTCSAPTRAAI